MAKTHDNHTHPDHSVDLPRLNRIGGQIAGVKKMIEEDRHCPEILTQIRAVRAALKGLEASILERHLNHCVLESMSANDPAAVQKKIDELKDLFKRYDD
jgi:CsoR family transcriptional regulator, copper-sensing transcriptional repressor